MVVRRLALALGAFFLVSLFFQLTAAPLAPRVAESAPMTCASVPVGLVSWWQFEPGSSVADRGPGGNNGTLVGNATRVTGLVGQALSLDGSGDYVSVPDAGSLDLSSAFSIDAWIMPDGTAAAQNRRIASKAAPGGHTYYLSVGADRSLIGQVLSSGGQTLYRTGANVVTGNVWQHVAMVYNGSAGAGSRITLYLNGVAQTIASSTPDNGGTPIASTSPLLIGGDTTSEQFDGLIDELDIFGRALGSEEVKALYLADGSGKCLIANSCAPVPSGIVSWWRAEGNANDFYGLNNGTLRDSSDISFVTGKVGQAFDFNGEGYIELPDSASLDLPQTFSIDAWINPDDLTGRRYIFSRRLSLSASVYQFHIEANGGALGGVVRTTDTITEYVTTGVTLKTGVWQHVVMTYNGAASAGNRMKFYVNGEQQTTTVSNDDGGGPAGTFNSGIIGFREAATAITPYEGLIDEIELFNQTLPANEVRSIFLAGSKGKCFGPEGKIEVINDLVPNNASGRFNLNIEGVATAIDAGDNDSTGEQTVQADTYTVSVTAGTLTSLSNYVTSIACRSNNGTGPIVAGGSAPATSVDVAVGGGADIVCIVTNTVPVPAFCAGMTFDRVLFGTEAADVLTGSGTRDLIYGFGGNDTINGGSGNDCIVGGDGNDTIKGGSGNDKMAGEEGNDTINGESGIDIADGGPGTDSCIAETRIACES